LKVLERFSAFVSFLSDGELLLGEAESRERALFFDIVNREFIRDGYMHVVALHERGVGKLLRACGGCLGAEMR
jgi:hypothetical protein